MEISQKKRGMALLLLVLFGGFGVHRFYVGKNLSGVFMIGSLFIFWPITAIWVIVDAILILLGNFTDKQGAVVETW